MTDNDRNELLRVYRFLTDTAREMREDEQAFRREQEERRRQAEAAPPAAPPPLAASISPDPILRDCVKKVWEALFRMVAEEAALRERVRRRRSLTRRDISTAVKAGAARVEIQPDGTIRYDLKNGGDDSKNDYDEVESWLTKQKGQNAHQR